MPGQYSWVAVLAPPSVARGLSYVTGWFMLTGEFASFVTLFGYMYMKKFGVSDWD